MEATYKWIMNGGVLIYWPQKKLRVQYTDFGADLVAGLMEVHWKTRHGVDKGAGWEEQWGPPPLAGDRQMYWRSSEYISCTGTSGTPW